MSDHATSAEAFSSVNATGKADQVRALVRATLEKHGPLADWQMQLILPDEDLRSIMARRLELTKDGSADPVGLMPEKRPNPKTGKDGRVWGLVRTHGAAPYRPRDLIKVRLHGELETTEFDFGDLLAISDAEIVRVVRELIGKLT